MVNAATQAHTAWRAAWAAVHHDGSVGLAGAIGGHPTRESELDGNQIESSAIECGAADFMALIAAVSKHRGLGEYEVSVGIEWAGTPLVIRTVDNSGYPYEASSIPLTKYVHVNATVIADAELLDYHWQVHDLAEHCVNQGGTTNVLIIKPPARDGQAGATEVIPLMPDRTFHLGVQRSHVGETSVRSRENSQTSPAIREQ